MGKIEVSGETKLRWPDGWERTRVSDWKTQTAWKKTYLQYQEMLVKELERLGATSIIITRADNERLDPGVAVWFSKQRPDYSWQTTLGLDSPAPTFAEIDDAFRGRAKVCHPDSQTPDIERYKRLVEARQKAKDWITGVHDKHHDYVMAVDRFKEARLNLCAIRLAFAAFRQLDRLGVPAILERTLDRAFKAALPMNASEVK